MTFTSHVSIPESLPRLPSRKRESHKGDFGRVLIVGGSRGMTGAVALAGTAALRSGAGLVTVAVPHCCQFVIAGYEPAYTSIGLGDDAAGRIDATLTEVLTGGWDDPSKVVMGIGPGIGRSESVDRLVCDFYQQWKGTLVVDADGLNALAAHPAVLRRPGGPRVMTPHPGEFKRLAGDQLGNKPSGSGPGTRGTLGRVARELAGQCRAVIVLKGHATLVTDGQTDYTNETGNPGMATGGSGDVLTGVITALVAQRMRPLDAAQLGVFVHGLAGDLAAQHLGQVGLIASDLPEYLPAAFQRVGET